MKNLKLFVGRSPLNLFYAALLAAIVLTGCSDPKNYPITKLTEAQKIELGQKLTSDEGQKLAGWMLRSSLSKDPLEGVTVAQALKQQDDWIAKEKRDAEVAAALKKKVDADRKLKQAEFANLLTVALINKKSSVGEYGKRWVGLEVAYENKGEKDILGVKGVLRITDIFGDKIMNIRWSFDQGIAAKQSFIEKGVGVNINQFMDDNMKLYLSDFDKLKSTFEVATIIFKDGTQMDAPE
jgi:hypothetical protein